MVSDTSTPDLQTSNTSLSQVYQTTLNYTVTDVYHTTFNSTFTDVNHTTFNSTFTDVNQTTSTAPPPSDPYDPYDPYAEYHVADFIYKNYLYLLVAIGFVGNGLSAFVMFNIKPLSSSSLYIIALAVADSTTLLMKLLFQELTGIHYSNVGCKFMWYFLNTTNLIAVWIVVAMTFERFIAVQFPFKANRLCTIKNAIITMSIGTFLICCFQSSYFVTINEEPTEVNSTELFCTYHKSYHEFVAKWKWVIFTVDYVVPGVCLAILNGLIIIAMNKSYSIQKEISNNKSEQLQEKTKQNRQLTIMLVTVSVLFIILVVPKGLYGALIQKAWDTDKNDYHAITQKYLVGQLIFFLADSNHAMNFFMYVIVGRKFREKLFEILLCRRSSSKRYMNGSTAVSQMPASRNTIASTVTQNGSYQPTGRNIQNGTSTY